ncbi:Phosphoglucomutase-2 [Clydaea vesicula]|uniref:Phosphoglucomutase-2 n=1 Tax=Clydaea vesicula TaxID=447962 RepID=A0AAD5U447_9FUNG|nr:Phosphoglucomutase-2 [Clydaea vesicula]
MNTCFSSCLLDSDRKPKESQSFQLSRQKMNSEILKLVNEYLQLDKNTTTRKEIEQLAKENNEEKLKLLLGSRLEFGTAGLRAAMGAGYSRMNELTVIQATQGLCAYLMEEDPKLKERGVVIGHDHRYNSKEFAELTAAVFLSKQVKVYYYKKLVHTPLVPFGVKKLGASCGIMITASHNPKNDNGYKVYWDNACQIIPPHDNGIAKSILKNLTPWTWDYNLVNTSTLASDPFVEMYDSYYKELGTYCHRKELNHSGELKFCYTAMHGVGYEFAKKGFETFGLKPFVATKEQIKPDPDFPTVEFPNPEEGKGALKLAIQSAEESGAKVIIANDPDADRLAVAERLDDGSWHIFSGNELGSILGGLVWDNYKVSHPNSDYSNVYMLASTVSSKMLNAIAIAEGFKFEDTLTGFKWLGNRAIDLVKEGKEVIFAFEEAIGFMIGDIVRDKDGVSALSVLCENALRLSIEGKSLFNYLNDLYAKYGYFVTENSYFICYDKLVIENIFKKIRYGDKLKELNADNEITLLNYPKSIGSNKIVAIRDLTIGYDNQNEGFKPTLPCSKSSEMITFKLDNGACITLRTSGTEPKIKYYSELASNVGLNEARSELGAVIQTFCRELLEPEVNKLIYRKN